MSTNPSNAVNFGNALSNEEGDNVRRGLALVGIILVFLFLLVVLKLMCNMFIDILILRDGDSLMRTLSEIRRLLCPCWHPRTEPSSTTGNTEMQATTSATTGNNNHSDRIDMENLLVGMTPDQKKELLAATLTSKDATKDDIVAWKASMEHQQPVAIVEAVITEDISQSASPKQPSSEHNNSDLLCPICIHDIQEGERICYSGLCHHVFHRDCLSSWLSTHSRICPYCRQEIVTQSMLEEAYQIKLNWLENATSDSEASNDDSSASSESDDSLDV